MNRWSPDPPSKPQETIYDFLRSLIGRVPWRDEEEKRKWEAWVAGRLPAVLGGSGRAQAAARGVLR